MVTATIVQEITCGLFLHAIQARPMNEYDLGYISRLERERMEWAQRNQHLNEMLKKMTAMTILFAFLAMWSIGCLIYETATR